ncbi:Serine-threonine/tyrosine-protein kinase, catalytic domain [Dillenia turbinata]|uniref:Serine-threonine/tyrosine-protein kinase, catalytic domain n=1 Tax=Dillenia turbinata TaxID=194707 RepID=A0AAN8UJU3_9MAGN
METLPQRVTIHHIGTHIFNSTPPMYGLAQCYQDLSHTDCLLCYAAARTKLPRCLPFISARIYLDGCFLRYDNCRFFNEYVDPHRNNSVSCSTLLDSVTVKSANPDFNMRVGWVIQNLRVEGLELLKQAAYALAQCWKTIRKVGCRDCLKKADHRARGCPPAKEGSGFDAGCYLRYSTEKFYNDGNETNGQAGKCDILLLDHLERKIVGRVSSTLSMSSLYFKYEIIEKATGYFDPSRKLGQGGVDGTRVAIKRLLFNTRQWVDAFLNEVNLIGGIQLKNLVNLLGCSIEGPESLLVYEEKPGSNSKLATKSEQLKGSHIFTKAVMLELFRDIKSNNVLLDENHNPKIADIGLARCFAAKKTQHWNLQELCIGYMAPQYLVQGQLTEKADVYRFGVWYLKLYVARMFYKFHKLHEIADSCLGDNLVAKEASNMLQIGLLCTQASAING